MDYCRIVSTCNFNSYIQMINRNKNNLNKYPPPQSPQLNSMTAAQKDYYFKKLLREEPHKEKHLHLACVTYMRDHYPEIVINHTRNQISAHSQVQANIYGYCKGFPDLFIAKKNNKYGGLFVEFKTPRSKYSVSPDQKYVHSVLEKQNYLVAVIWDYSDFKELINTYLNENIKNKTESCDPF